jgi:hypothetical protein
LETPQAVCPDVLVRYKHEVNGNLDFRGSGVRPEDCGIRHHDQDGEHDKHDEPGDGTACAERIERLLD